MTFVNSHKMQIPGHKAVWSVIHKLLHLTEAKKKKISVRSYEGESINNQPNLFRVAIHLFFFYIISLQGYALGPTVFKCH